MQEPVLKEEIFIAGQENTSTWSHFALEKQCQEETMDPYYNKP